MSHLCGWVVNVAPTIHIGPDTGTPETSENTWEHEFNYLSTGTKFVVLHFMNVTLPASNRLEVDLGYGTDVFTAADGGSFWTRPVNIHQLPGGTIPIRYITNGSSSGEVFLDRYGRGQSLQSVEPGFDSITNCDPFLPGPWDEPDFPHIPGSTEPKYEPLWICDKNNPPVWENARCAPLGSVQRNVSRSVGMILSIHEADSEHPNPYVSTCSVTLIDSDLVALAAHCISDHPFSVPASSVTFDYEVNCDGSLVPAYDAVFYKVISPPVKYRYTDGRDYAILQLRGAPPVPPVPVRNGVPSVGEPVFGVHHPNGAVKKVSPSGSGTVPVQTTGIEIEVNLDVAGGSSGSGLFDMSGRLLGVLASGTGCSVGYSSGALMLDDPIELPDPPTERAAMLVIDRSGSMSEPEAGGGVKINEARDAAELFISIMRASMGNEAGIVSFASNASSPVDFPIELLTEASRGGMLGVLPGIGPGGRTSIGDGLAAARNQLNTTSGLPRSILLLTDGMENEPQPIADVGGLATIEITAIGFGTESNLDEPRLTDLAQTHGGYYKRAGTGLELRKFFALAFGDIFEAGALADPELHMPRDVREGPWIPFHVCGEEAVTVVAGWDDAETSLSLEVRTPDGQVLDLSAGGIETDEGQTWRFARIPLPQHGERDGTWTARALRPGGGGEFPPPAPPVDYFINVIARGGPSLRPFEQPRRIYTGDVLHPKVIMQYPDETVPPAGEVTLTVRRPDASVGTILAGAGLGAPRMVDGDVIPARQATLSRIEADTGAPVTSYVEETHMLSSRGAAAETFRYAGVYGVRLTDALVVEGTYTFHAKAQIQIGGCTLTREARWSHHVSVGIDPDATTVSVSPSDDGGLVVTFVPQDRYGNLVGPGAGDDLDVTPLPGCTVVGGLVDLGDGRYQQELDCDPDGPDAPGIVVTQPGRDPAVLVPPVPRRTVYRYAVQFHCGVEEECCGECASLSPGRYATSISILNGGERPVLLVRSVLPTTLAGATSGRWPEAAGVRARDRIELSSRETTVVDCCSLMRLLLGGEPHGPQSLTVGTVLIESPQPLHVKATYTMVTGDGAGSSIDVEVVEPQCHVVREPVQRPDPPARGALVEPRRAPPPRPQDVLRRDIGESDQDYQEPDASDQVRTGKPGETKGRGRKQAPRE